MAEQEVHDEVKYKLTGAFELHLQSGRVYKEYCDGRRVLEYPNGKEKELHLTDAEVYLIKHNMMDLD